MSAPAKPWQQPAASGAGAGPASTSSAAGAAGTAGTASGPSVPARPSSLATAGEAGAAGSAVSGGTSATTYGGGYGGYGGGYGGSYGGGYGGYGSPYSRFGGGAGYGGFGGYGGMGGYGAGGYGMGYGGFGGGMYDPNDPQSLSRRMENGSAATFQMIESIVGAFGGFAQMLESTYMTTQSSFFAMVSVAQQFGHLRNSLGSVLGIFAIVRWVRWVRDALLGRPSPDLSPGAFSTYQQRGGHQRVVGAQPSRKPLLFFLVAIVGLPYLMGKLIKRMYEKEEAERAQAALDPSQLEFARALYDFVAQDPAVELQLTKGDLVAILSKSDPLGNESEWWRGRTRDGRVGWFPNNYCEIIQQRQAIDAPKLSVDEFQKGISAL